MALIKSDHGRRTLTDSLLTDDVRSAAPAARIDALVSYRLRRLFGEPVPSGDLGRFFERLAIMLRAGMGVPDSIRAASRNCEPEIRSMMEAAARPISEGIPLHKALAKYSDRLPVIVIPVLEVGEVAGTLEGSALRLADAFVKSDSVDQRFRYSVVNPKMAALFLALSFVGFGFASFFLPSLLDLCFLLLKAVLLFFAARLVIRYAMRWDRLRLATDTVKLAIPVSGQVSRKLSAARWGRSFATMWQAGVPISQALEVSSRSALNAYYETDIQRAALITREGTMLSQALGNTTMLPAYLLDVLRTGESTGRFAESLESFVTILEDEAMQLATQEFVAVVAIGNLILALIAVSMALGMPRLF